ncbi:MAG TPA: hypothetical protein VKA31_11310 [Mariprofundaceae bacterium]|nr:hypothetical protein [Mariprofundaceae bacterium]
MAEMDKDVLILLGRIDGKLDDLKQAFTQHVIDDAKVEQRLRTVEKRQSYFLGAAALLGAGGSLLSTLILKGKLAWGLLVTMMMR